jgi:hypothetical protein
MQEKPLVGRRVVINGLVGKPDLNGRTGTAVRFDDDKERYAVQLHDTSSFMIKPCNLLPVVCITSVLWLYVSCFHVCIHHQVHSRVYSTQKQAEDGDE